MVSLTREGRTALDEVIAAHRVRVTVRQEAEAEARTMIEQRVAAAARLESEAVRAAIAAGVPRSRIGAEGLGTKDYRTVARVLAVTDAEQQGVVAAVAATRAVLHRNQVHRGNAADISRFGHLLHPAGDVLLRIDWPGYEADALGILAETAGIAVLDLRGWAHRVYPGDDDDWAALADEGSHLDTALRYEDRLRAAVVNAASS